MNSKKYSRDDKFEMVLQLIKEPSKAEEISQKYGIGFSTLYKWRSRFIEGGRTELEAYKTGLQPKAEYKIKSDELLGEISEYKQRIAELACENEILKKKRIGPAGRYFERICYCAKRHQIVDH